MAGREILVVWAGRHRRRAWDELCADYRARIAREVPIRDLPVKVAAGGDDPARRREEGRALLAALPEPCWIVALDGGGRSQSSAAFAAELGRRLEEHPHPIAFVVGSDLGLDPEVLAAARQTLSLGPMVLGHELARLVLYEQLYRAVAIARGIKYHRPPL